MSKSRAIVSALRSLTLPASGSFVCRSCAASASNGRRPFTSSSQRRQAAPPPPPPSGYTKLLTRRLISLSGPDAVHFLQGVITADIAPSAIPRTQGFYAAFLNAKGRVLYDTFIYPDIYHLLDASGKFKESDGKRGERWIVECDADEVKNLYTHLRRYKLRAKLDLRIIEEGELGIWQTWRDASPAGKEGEAKWTAHGIPASMSPENTIPVPPQETGMITLNDPRAPGLGRRIIAPGEAPPPQEIQDLEKATPDSYKIRRYLRGVQEGQSEIQSEKALPQESNIDYMSGISYRKGCYVGQELTIRTHHTGVVRKRALPLMLYPLGGAEPEAMAYNPGVDVEIPPFESIMDRVTKEGRQRGLGKFLTGVGNIGIGVCRLEGVQDGGPFKVQWKLDAREGHEGEDKAVGVKAFVPSWHLKAESK